MTTAHASPGSTAYARALAEAVEAEGGHALLEEIGGGLSAFSEAWQGDPNLRGYFLGTEVTRKQKLATMDKLVVDRLPKLLANFLRLLLRRDRLPLVPEIAAAYGMILDAALGRVPVTITTAVPVPESEFQAWQDDIQQALGGEAIVTHVVKPDILAGAIIRVGDRIVDGSARRHLNALHTRIIERGMQRHALPA